MTSMDTNQAIEHGRRWLAAGWEWKPGQIGLYECDDGFWRTLLVTFVGSDGRPMSFGHEVPAGTVPDMRDGGTRGHALEQVREAWGDPDITATRFGRWVVEGLPTSTARDSEYEALLAAREAAPAC